MTFFGGTMINLRNAWALPVAAVLLLSVSVSCGSEDASPDAGALADAVSTDAVVECSSDPECDDGLFCNGVESCSPAGICQAGIAAECNDGIPCTVDVCSNERRECVSAAPDVDEDGHGDASCLDNQGESLGDDCDDLDVNRFPGNVEFCDAEHHDEDCDATTFGIVDVDADGFPSAGCCNTDATNTLVCGTDCDDNRANVNAFASEVCDGLDNNCDGTTDEGVSVAGFVDADGDGFGDTALPLNQCAGLGQFSTIGGDCDDADPTRNPSQVEICDGIDNDCNEIDDDNTQDVDWFLDDDGDGFGTDSVATIVSCTPIAGRSVLSTDCDDEAAGINPASQELCDGLDNDCNGLLDYRIGVNDFEDDDGDGLVDIACAPLGVDCDDTNPITGPGTVEQCDGQDNDCDGLIDENVVETLWFRDNDEDGYGSVTSGTLVSCQAPLGYTTAGGDCDDGDEDKNPGSIETCNGDDDDCDSAVDETPAMSLCPARPNASKLCSLGECGFTCDPEYADCNQVPESGCETFLTTDANNCGACGVTCIGGNQTGSCQAGACECLPGFDDCDGNPDNGCETDVFNNPDSCGTCGNFCLFENADAKCAMGICEVEECFDGYDDCDAVAGCESNVVSDTQCGSCTNNCTTLPNTNAVCQMGSFGYRCAVNSCVGNYADCEDFSDDGCETNLDTDGQRCGSCNNDCTTDFNSDGTCSSGACVCNPGFLDCGTFNRCDTDGQSDMQNCGSCGNDCNVLVTSGQPQCNNSQCEAFCNDNEGNCDANPLDCETDFSALNNCGGCDNVCTAQNGTARCDNFGSGFSCATDCDPGYWSCDANPLTCEANTESDPNNCGGCGNSCGVGGVCTSYACDQIQEIAVGENFTCTLRSGGSVVCWGNNAEGQLGNGNTTPSFTPVLVDASTMGTAIQLRSGGKHSCALGITGTFCWGDNDAGQLGSDTGGVSSSSPLEVIGAPQFTNLAIGASHSCGVDTSNNVYCWGNNNRGQLGRGTMDTGSATPIQVNSIPNNDIMEVVAGDDFTCARSFGGGLYCWGAGTDGQIGNDLAPFTDVALPELVLNHIPVDRLALGSLSACSIRNSGVPILECWGDDAFNQLGDGAPATDQNAPVTTGLASASDLTVGAGHACMRSSFGSMYCWGNNAMGQGGQGNTSTPITTGTQVMDVGTTVMQIATGTGANHVCVLTNGEQVRCWGSNIDGQVGLDPAGGTIISSPTTVLGL